jgi:hypothetical protein
VAQIIIGQIFASLGRNFDRLPTIHTKLLVNRNDDDFFVFVGVVVIPQPNNL